MDTFLLQMGISPSDLFAAFTGGVVAALVTSGPRPNAWGIFVAVIVGTGTGAYFGPIAPPYVGIKPSPGATFGVGVLATPIIKGLIAAYSRLRWSPLDKKIEPGE